jgi:acetyltransferase-like isoleucine patch superfamily enzyme
MLDFRTQEACQKWWEQGVSFSPTAILRRGAGSKLEIGIGAIIGSYTILDLQNDLNEVQPFPTKLVIGECTAIGEFNNIRPAGGEIIIGNHCLTAQFVSIIATNHNTSRSNFIRDQPWDTNRRRVVIGDDVWIGTHVTILPGVVIGPGCVIGAGAVVTRDIPDYSIAAGIPARVIKSR